LALKAFTLVCGHDKKKKKSMWAHIRKEKDKGKRAHNMLFFIKRCLSFSYFFSLDYVFLSLFLKKREKKKEDVSNQEMKEKIKRKETLH
jgi:hypothetical protein